MTLCMGSVIGIACSRCEGPGHCHYLELDFADNVPPEVLNRALDTLKEKQFQRVKDIAELGKALLL